MPDTTPTDSGSPAPCCTSCGSWWRLPLLLALVLAALVLARSRGGPDVPAPDGSQVVSTGSTEMPSAGETVSLAVDFGDGRLLAFNDVPWHDGMTVDQLLAAVQAMPHGPTFARQGAGQSAMLTAIDGVANEGGRGRNWLFSVNDRAADRSFGVYVLRPGDRVLWRFLPAQ